MIGGHFHQVNGCCDLRYGCFREAGFYRKLPSDQESLRFVFKYLATDWTLGTL